MISKFRSTAMGVRQFIRPDVAASAIAHLSVLGLVFLLTEVHPFSSVTAEPITVEIVTADQLDKSEAKPDQATPFPRDSLTKDTDSLTKDDASSGAGKQTAAPSPAPQKNSQSPSQKDASAQNK